MINIEQLSVKEKSGRLLLDQVSIKIPSGTVVGLTGHSGCGKTTLLRSIFGMLHTDCKIANGKILMDETDLLSLSRRNHRSLCGRKMGYIPQSPMTAFDSRLKIGFQIIETFKNSLKMRQQEAIALAEETLNLVNLRETKRVMNAYPGELSGGMLQRVAAAILLGMSPDYIFADEPTAALDEENRDLLLELLETQMRDQSILLVSHDAAALEKLCSNVYVLGEGRVIEQGSMEQLLAKPETDWMKQFSGLSTKESRGDWEWKKL